MTPLLPTPEEFRAYLVKQGDREFDMNSPCGCALHGFYGDEKKLDVRVDFEGIMIHRPADTHWTDAIVVNVEDTWLEEFQIKAAGKTDILNESICSAAELVKILDEVFSI